MKKIFSDVSYRKKGYYLIHLTYSLSLHLYDTTIEEGRGTKG